jgi:hypothetical protein
MGPQVARLQRQEEMHREEGFPGPAAGTDFPDSRVIRFNRSTPSDMEAAVENQRRL